MAALTTIPLSLVCRRLTINTTTSLPRGLYRLRPERQAVRGDVVDFAVPASVVASIPGSARFLSRFHLLKRLVAAPGDDVCLDGETVVVDGRLVARLAKVDSLGRALPRAFVFCGAVPDGFGVVATPGSTSLDSRFFGPISLAGLTVAEPIWTRSSP